MTVCKIYTIIIYANRGVAVDVKVLSRWLAPQDRVLAILGRDHTTFTDQQAEFTCLWFQDELTKFIKGESQFLLINGQPGSGKSTLAASIVDRLQRPHSRRSFHTLFCSIGKLF
jgi:pantothenate kinase-related protein Tda10